MVYLLVLGFPFRTSPGSRLRGESLSPTSDPLDPLKWYADMGPPRGPPDMGDGLREGWRRFTVSR